ncbi:MAG: PQQ-binding-like beta-propeller repeat protein, partial [Thermoplasmatota archaeon]
FSAAYIPSSPALYQGRVYFGAYDSTFYCLDAGTGERIWNTTMGSDVHSSPSVSQDRVLVGCNDGLLYCLNRNNGSIIWNLDLGPDPLESSPVISGDRIAVTYTHGLVVVSLDEGGILHSFLLGNSAEVSPSVNSGRILFGDNDGYLRCVGLADQGDDDAYEIGKEDDTPRDLLFMVIGSLILLTVIILVFFRRYKKIREKNREHPGQPP